MAIETATVISTKKAFKPSKSLTGLPLPLGSVKIRLSSGQTGGGPRIERFAQPLFNYLQVPLKGEQIVVVKAAGPGTLPGLSEVKYYYIGALQIHGNNHLNPMPGIYDVLKGGGEAARAISSAAPALPPIAQYSPGENFVEKKDVLKLQPYEGDILIEGRNRSAIRLGSSLQGSTSQYAQSPWFKGKQNSPITVISNGFKGGGPGAALDKSSIKGFAKSAISKFKSQQSYAIDDPDKTDSIFILSSDSQKIDMTLSKGNRKIGKKVLPLSRYVKPQGILSADRIILNSKKDEILLVANTDVKIVTKGWNSDMEEFFDTILDFMEEVIKQNKELEKGLKTNASEIHPTPAGPSGPPTSAGKYIAGASKTSSIRSKMTKLKNVIKGMKG